MSISNAQDAVVVVSIKDRDGRSVDYECREHIYEASAMKIGDPFSVTIPAPDGLVLGVDETMTDVSMVGQMGSPVTLSVKDPNVNGNAPVQKLTGIVTHRSLQTTRDGGCVLAVAGADIGWHLTGNVEVFKILQGISWEHFFARLCGIELDAKWNAISDRYGWGFKGVRKDNDLNRAVKSGAAGAHINKLKAENAAHAKAASEAHRKLEQQQNQSFAPSQGRSGANVAMNQAWNPSIPMPVLQSEVGETIDEILLRMARFEYFLVNVAQDGYIQIFRPNYSQDCKYQFYRYKSNNPLCKQNNIMNPVLDEQAEPLCTRAECWSTVVNRITHPDQVPANVNDVNAGKYHGTFPLVTGKGKHRVVHEDTTYFPVHRLSTYTDQNQMGQDRVNKRAEWKFKKGAFDSWTYTFDTVGHSQNGVQFVEDSMCYIKDEVYGLDGQYYISDVKFTRRLASPGVDRSGNTGTKTSFTIKKANLLMSG